MIVSVDAASTIELLALVKENQSEEAVNVLFGRYLPRITRWARGRLPRGRPAPECSDNPPAE